jgi:hypothetical protein
LAAADARLGLLGKLMRYRFDNKRGGGRRSCCGTVSLPESPFEAGFAPQSIGDSEGGFGPEVASEEFRAKLLFNQTRRLC